MYPVTKEMFGGVSSYVTAWTDVLSFVSFVGLFVIVAI